MSLMNKVEYEKQYAASNVSRYATWEDFAAERQLEGQFKPHQLADIKDTFDRWKERDRLFKEAFAPAVTTNASN